MLSGRERGGRARRGEATALPSAPGRRRAPSPVRTHAREQRREGRGIQQPEVHALPADRADLVRRVADDEQAAAAQRGRTARRTSNAVASVTASAAPRCSPRALSAARSRSARACVARRSRVRSPTRRTAAARPAAGTTRARPTRSMLTTASVAVAVGRDIRHEIPVGVRLHAHGARPVDEVAGRQPAGDDDDRRVDRLVRRRCDTRMPRPVGRRPPSRSRRAGARGAPSRERGLGRGLRERGDEREPRSQPIEPHDPERPAVRRAPRRARRATADARSRSVTPDASSAREHGCVDADRPRAVARGAARRSSTVDVDVRARELRRRAASRPGRRPTTMTSGIGRRPRRATRKGDAALDAPRAAERRRRARSAR